MELRFLRDTDGREIDFVVLRAGRPEFRGRVHERRAPRCTRLPLRAPAQRDSPVLPGTRGHRGLRRCSLSYARPAVLDLLQRNGAAVVLRACARRPVAGGGKNANRLDRPPRWIRRAARAVELVLDERLPPASARSRSRRRGSGRSAVLAARAGAGRRASGPPCRAPFPRSRAHAGRAGRARPGRAVAPRARAPRRSGAHRTDGGAAVPHQATNPGSDRLVQCMTHSLTIRGVVLPHSEVYTPGCRLRHSGCDTLQMHRVTLRFHRSRPPYAIRYIR